VDGDTTDNGPLPAGAFGEWLAGMQAALRGDADSDVPCGTCTACCTSSQFVHIGPDDTETLARIPRELLFPAPRRPGHFVLGYDEQGRCPMLRDGRCSIYRQRPRTCRVYDCRVFEAAGVPVDDDKPAIGTRARRWRFSYPADTDRALHEAVRRAATAVGPTAAPNATQLAVRAVESVEL
jgi:Fe-S-cluster containining protein